MSVAKIETVKRSKKEYVCEKCRTVLPAGSAYRHFTVGFRSKYKHVRCMKDECFPRTSERESSRLSDVYAAQESAEDQLNALPIPSPAEDITSILEELAQAIRDVASEYETASQNDYGTVFNQDAADRADTLNSAADEIETYDAEQDFVDCEVCDGTGDVEEELEDLETGEVTEESHVCDTCEGAGRIMTVETIQAVIEFINGVELP